MELIHYIGVIRRRWWLFLLGPLVAGVVAYAVSESQTDVYQAESTLLVNHTETAGVLKLDDVLASERLTTTYADLITQRPILDSVISELSLNFSEDTLRSKVTVDAVVDARLIRVQVRDSDPALASSIAGTLADDLVASGALGSGSTGDVSIAEPASLPTSRVAPRVALNTAMAIFVGLMLATGIVLILESLRNAATTTDDYRVRSLDDVTKLGLVPVAVIPRFRENAGKNGHHPNSVNAAWSTESSLAEIFRFMRTNIEFAATTHPAHVLLVTSPNRQEGKSTTATNLAVAMAKSGRRTVLVDANLRSPTLHAHFRVPNFSGLTTLLKSDSVTLQEIACRTDVPDLSLIPSGPPTIEENAADLLASNRLGAVRGARPERVRCRHHRRAGAERSRRRQPAGRTGGRHAAGA